MWWSKKEHDKKKTLVFKTKSGVKRSRPQNISNEQTDSECCREESIERSESMEHHIKGENVNG